MKTSLLNPFEKRRLVVNPWFEEHAAVPVQFQPMVIGSSRIKCIRKLESWRPFPAPRDPSASNRWAGGRL